jgi:hypothetical protein
MRNGARGRETSLPHSLPQVSTDSSAAQESATLKFQRLQKVYCLAVHRLWG